MIFDFNKELDDYFASDFAKKEDSWLPVAEYIATIYMKKFLENLEFMTSVLKNGVKNKLTPNENWKLMLVYKNICLEDCIDDTGESFSLDIGKMKKSFVPMSDSERKIAEKQLKIIDNESKEITNTKFSELDHMADFLLNFINKEEFRAEYYKKVTAKKDVNSSQIVNSMINQKINETFVGDLNRIN